MRIVVPVVEIQPGDLLDGKRVIGIEPRFQTVAIIFSLDNKPGDQRVFDKQACFEVEREVEYIEALTH